MTIKLLVVSTKDAAQPLLEEVKRQAGNSLEVVLHLDAGTGPRAADHAYCGAGQQVILSPAYFPLHERFLDQSGDTSDGSAQSGTIFSQHNMHDRLHLTADRVALEIQSSGATHCLFFDMPRGPYDTLIHQVAKSQGLAITILTASVFEGRFFSLNDPAAMGQFEADRTVAALDIDAVKAEMAVEHGRPRGTRPVPVSALARLSMYLLKRRPSRAFNPFYLRRTLTNIQDVYGKIPDWRDPFARFFHQNDCAYLDYLASNRDHDADLSGDFVYIPLQPRTELPLPSEDGRFRDQAYAIERLSEILPAGVRILVQERPDTGAVLHGPILFHRLRRVSKLAFVSPLVAPDKLLSRAKFVATVNGSVAWHAVQAGKPALVFGPAWYRNLPGVHGFSDTVTYEQIISSPIDKPALATAMGALLRRAHEGVLPGQSAQDLSGERIVDRTTAAALIGLLRAEIPPSFDSAVG